ncbi:hypothetical protein [Sphingomonas glacialis]|uniref:hypothetical protein n=1 Tax=Sphingomonas glacialis TaxID=658225 RepID=UPI00112A80BD|nr:hypothetical protein [Sphingomonas glacialis]
MKAKPGVEREVEPARRATLPMLDQIGQWRGPSASIGIVAAERFQAAAEAVLKRQESHEIVVSRASAR